MDVKLFNLFRLMIKSTFPSLSKYMYSDKFHVYYAHIHPKMYISSQVLVFDSKRNNKKRDAELHQFAHQS